MSSPAVRRIFIFEMRSRIMQSRPALAYALPVLLTITGLSTPSGLQAQTEVAMRASPVAAELGRRTQSRAARWAAVAPVIHCGPAPLTERPGAAAVVARPRVVPLEEAFLDAAIAKRRVSRTHAPAGR
jgi:hypothetical protein